MSDEADSQVWHLLVTGPARDLLYAHFSRLFYGHEGVLVIKDRRYGERRAARRSVPRERRSRERRRQDPDWVVPPDLPEL
jgi:hypothetical protein